MPQQLFLFVLVVAAAACGGHCLTPLIRARNIGEVTGRYIAVLKESTSHERILELVEQLQSTEGSKVYGYVEVALKAVMLELSDEALQKVLNFSEVKYIEEEGLAYAASSNTIVGNDRWYLDRLDQFSASLDNTYEPLTGDGEGVDVYILDTGIDFTHHEFVHSHQHIQFEYRAKYAGYDAVDQNNYAQGNLAHEPMRGADCSGHGTCIASLVGGNTCGTARKANLYSVRVLPCDASRGVSESVILDGLDFVAATIRKRSQSAIVVLAMSSRDTFDALNEALENLYHQNVVIIGAAGDSYMDACDVFPSNSSHVITVGTILEGDKVAPFSNYGPCIDLFAPGNDVLGNNRIQCGPCTNLFAGSSLATAVTAGVAASYLAQLPHLTPSQIRNKLLSQSLHDVINFNQIPTESRSNTPNILLNLRCGGSITVTSESGRLQSPGFPRNYMSHLDCEWTLTAENKTDRVLLKFSYIKMEKNYDYLKLCIEDNCTEEEKIFLTGNYGETECGYMSLGGSLTITMSTDSFTESPGFGATYASVRADEEVLVKKCSTQNKTMQLDIHTSEKNFFSMQKDWVEFFAGRRKGISIATLDEVSGSTLATDTFDTHASQEYSNQLATTIEQIRPGKIVLVALSNEGVTNLTTVAKRALASIGSDKINLTNHESWALIGIKGGTSRNTLEQVVTSADVHLSAQFLLQPFHKHGVEIKVEVSTGPGGHFVIKRGSESIYSSLEKGVHVVTLDKDLGKTVLSKTFKSSFAYYVSPSILIFRLVENQPAGTIVIIAANDEEQSHNHEKLKEACKNVGSALIYQVGHRDSWAIVGRKGAPSGSVPEVTCNNGSCSVASFLAQPDTGAIQCSVHLQSLNHNSIKARITVNGTKNVSSSEGVIIAVLEKTKCAIEISETFNLSTYDQLANFIKLIPSGRIVLASSAGVQNITDPAQAALEAIGSAIIRNIQSQGAWVIIGRKGAPRGTVLEQYHQHSTALGATIPLASADAPFISVTSAEHNSLFTSMDQAVRISPGPEYGITIAVVDENNLNVLHQQTFDTFEPSQSQHIANLINSLPNGRVVAIAIICNGTLELSEAAKQAIEGLGSAYIREIEPVSFRNRYQSSWTIVGRKGAPQGTALEASSNVGPSEVISQVLPNTPYDNESCVILVESAGFKSLGGLQLTINGVNTSLPKKRGIRVAVFEENQCGIENISSYDTSSSQEGSAELTNFLAGVPTGRIVVASVWEEAHQRLGEDAKLALESIGSAFIRGIGICEAWAIIGRKGASPGSVPEAFLSVDAGAQSTAVALGGVMTLKPACSDTPYPLNCSDQGV